jgi:hypothetical protein
MNDDDVSFFLEFGLASVSFTVDGSLWRVTEARRN